MPDLYYVLPVIGLWLALVACLYVACRIIERRRWR
jgi:hypothetical protein